jgi:hypothetical protein
MTRRLSLTLIASFALALVLAAVSTAAHPGHEHKVLGTVTMAASDHVMLEDTDGKGVTVFITADTKVLKDKETMKVEDIKTGMRVVVTAVTENEKMLAKTIELGAAPDTN